jgi:hypothetical protein
MAALTGGGVRMRIVKTMRIEGNTLARSLRHGLADSGIFIIITITIDE